MITLRERILSEHSKKNCARIVKWIGSNPSRFDELVKLFLRDEYRVVQRAAWPLSEVVKEHLALVRKHLGNILKNINKKDLHDAVKRNTVRLLEDIEIPAKFHGLVMNFCFDYISSPTEKPAVKASALTILQNLSKQYPDIRQELKAIIQDRWDHETAAFRSRAKTILKQSGAFPAH
ncbi:MAG: hypothetical protein ABIR30_13405 [Chitinophagaceae bacterium]